MKIKTFKRVAATLTVFACTFVFCSTGASAAEIKDEVAVSSSSQNIKLYTTQNDLPSSYSSKDLGYVTEVKNQVYNDCWGYAGLATYESMLLRNGFQIESMSVDHLNAWATTRSSNKGWIRNYSGEGFADITLGYLTSWQGGVQKSDAGVVDLNTKGDLVATDLAKYGVTAIEFLSCENPDAIKREIMENGGVYSSYASTSSCISKDRTSYYMPSTYSSNSTGHAIEIVGWDDNYSQSKFDGSIGKKPTNSGAWLAKNSWGDTYNSLGGYFWISYEDKYIFSEKYKPSYSIKSVQEIDENVKLVQNEIYGATYEFSYADASEITYLNKFSFTDEYSNLDKVIFETECLNAEYTIYYIPTVNNEPVTDKNKWTELYDGVADYKGYICADIEDFDLPEGAGAIAVTIDTTQLNEGLSSTNAEYVKNSIGVGEWLTNNGKYVFLNESEYGDSYIFYDNTMTDLLDWYETNLNDQLGGTFVIKAVTTKKTKPTMLGDVNLDGKLNITDPTLIQKYCADITDLSATAKANADFNQDGKINVTDATAVQKDLVK